MQFMNQQQIRQEMSSGLSSESEAVSGVRTANFSSQSAISKAPDIDRAKIGGVSVHYATGSTSKMSLAPPKRAHSKQQNR